LAGEDYFARLCVEWEGIARASESSDLRVVCARFGIIIGQGGGALKAMLLPAKSGLSGPLGTGKQWWSWIALPDVVRALVHALEQDAIRGPLNVVAPEPIRQADFQRSLCRALHRPAWIPAPAFGVRLLLGRFADEVLASKRVTPRVLSETGFEWSFPTLESIFGDLFSNTNKGVFLALLGSVALLAAPYGRTPHLIDIARDYSTSPFGLDVMLHAGMHLALVPWLFVALYFRPFKG
jgi:NAD dependent epimerase/dehydratase family enzyme